MLQANLIRCLNDHAKEPVVPGCHEHAALYQSLLLSGSLLAFQNKLRVWALKGMNPRDGTSSHHISPRDSKLQCGHLQQRPLLEL